MGQKLLQYYKYISDQLGREGKVQLAIKTKISSILAATTEDSPEILEKFKSAIEEMTDKPAPDF